VTPPVHKYDVVGVENKLKSTDKINTSGAATKPKSYSKRVAAMSFLAKSRSDYYRSTSNNKYGGKQPLKAII